MARSLGEFLTSPPAQAVLWGAAALILTITATFGLLSLRDRIRRKESMDDHLTKFREMQARGVLNAAEFRTIKTVLGERLRSQVTDSDLSS